MDPTKPAIKVGVTFDNYPNAYHQTRHSHCDFQMSKFLITVFHIIIGRIKYLGVGTQCSIRSTIFNELANFENRSGIKDIEKPQELTVMGIREVSSIICDLIGVYDTLNTLANPIEPPPEDIVKVEI